MRYTVRPTTGEANCGSPSSTSSVGSPTAVDSAASANADNLGWFGWLGVVRVVVRAGRWSSAVAADRRRLGAPTITIASAGDGRAGPGPMRGALDAEAGQLALDHSREGPQPPDGQQLLGDLAGHPSKGPGRWLRGGRPPGRWW